MKQSLIYILIALSVGAIAFFAGRSSAPAPEVKTVSSTANNNPTITELRQAGGHKFINPLLECDNYYPTKTASLELLENQLQAYVSGAISSGKASKISLYYRDLNNGPWIGIGENDFYAPASLLKVPIMIAALKYAENNPEFLKKKIKYSQLTEDGVVPNITDVDVVKLGSTYTIEKLLEYMIISSDNEAKNLILFNIQESVVTDVYADLGIIVPGIRTPDDFMSVKDYSAFFRILYNATYLNKQMSEKGLEILSRAKFNAGLRKGVPEGMVVCNKFGERGIPGTNLKQLHDCGIIYSEGHPYLLCVMTRGEEWDELANIIAEISSMVHNWQSK